MRNIEIKVSLLNKTATQEQLRRFGTKYQHTIRQCDYYFETDNKEKLRIINGSEFQLITYRRIEKLGCKDFHYDIKELDQKENGSLLNKRAIVKKVEKTREMWQYRHTRIHIDYVEQLGDFLEVETVVKGISLKTGENEFATVIGYLGIDTTNSIPASYSDLFPVAV